MRIWGILFKDMKDVKKFPTSSLSSPCSSSSSTERWRECCTESLCCCSCSRKRPNCSWKAENCERKKWLNCSWKAENCEKWGQIVPENQKTVKNEAKVSLKKQKTVKNEAKLSLKNRKLWKMRQNYPWKAGQKAWTRVEWCWILERKWGDHHGVESNMMDALLSINVNPHLSIVGRYHRLPYWHLAQGTSPGQIGLKW